MGCAPILKALSAAERKRAGKDPQPTAAITDFQSAKPSKNLPTQAATTSI